MIRGQIRGKRSWKEGGEQAYRVRTAMLDIGGQSFKSVRVVGTVLYVGLR